MEVSKLVAFVSIVLLVAAVPVISAASDAEVEDGIVQGDADIRDAPVSAGSVTVGEYMRSRTASSRAMPTSVTPRSPRAPSPSGNT